VVADTVVADTVVGAVTRRLREGYEGTNVAGVVLLCASALVGIFMIVVSVLLYVDNRDLTRHQSCHTVHPAELVLLLEFLPRLRIKRVALGLLLHERHESVLGLAQLLVGAGAEAIELTEVDLANSPRVSPVRLLAGRQFLCCWHLVSSLGRLSQRGSRSASGPSIGPDRLTNP
jgi:hypothetical protein